jgi:hypothetical protein
MALGGELLVEDPAPTGEWSARPGPAGRRWRDAGAGARRADWLVPTNLPAWLGLRLRPRRRPARRAAGGARPFGVVPVRDAVAHDPMERPADPIETKPGGNLRVRFSRGWVEFAPG